ncbi:MAG: hydroxyacylglutathione hydrolase [Rhodobiaceae bacterium]|nr:hydroxyacylglutathione hydrolase [Rhodobiaceae bacterium]
MATLECYQFLCQSDNYCVLVHDPETGATAAIDAPESAAVEQALATTGWTLTDILVTHCHHDHVAGIEALKSVGVTVTGPAKEASKIPGIDKTVSEGDTITLGNHTARIIETPGHTLGHIAYWFADDALLFAGDTLFALGCGRVFEGTMEMMWASLDKIRALPNETVAYCGHEYTAANARFAVTVDPENAALKARAAEVDAKRAKGEPTLPTTIGLERATNPFLRADDPAIRAALGMADASDAAVFAEIRGRKDRF